MQAYYPYIILAAEAAYFIGIILLAGKIIMDTRTTSKTLAYLLLIIFVPIAGIIIYFAFGVNYRKNKFYNFKINYNKEVYNKIINYITETSYQVFNDNPKLKKYQTLFKYLFNESQSPLFDGNKVELLINGEEKFKKVFEVISNAKHHIHLEYYIYDDDIIGNKLADKLIEKVGEGVKVRLLYDGFGSSRLRRRLAKRMMDGGVEVAPVNRIRFKLFANRINYRDHRKIIIVDGHEAFTGGINVSDKYINNNSNDLYWRDTHLYIKGPGIFYLQYLFLSTWTFANKKQVKLSKDYFDFDTKESENKLLQVAASGPDTRPTVLLSTLSAIYAATTKIYITTPYFIPVDSILSSIKQAALAGLDVRIIVPEKSDSKFVNAAAYSYYSELMSAGVKVYLYKRGFVHAKTIVIDDILSIVGTANMDVRSHELNFEVNTIVYDNEINNQLTSSFLKDLNDCSLICPEEWMKRNKFKMFFEYIARLFSPLL